MIRKSIRNYRSRQQTAPRLCDVVVDENNTVSLQFKQGDRVESITVPDFLSQLGEAMKSAP